MLYVKCNRIGFTKITSYYLLLKKKMIPLMYNKLPSVDYTKYNKNFIVVDSSGILVHRFRKTAKKIINEHIGVVGIFSFINPINKLDSFIHRHIIFNETGDIESLNKIIYKVRNHIFEEDFEYFLNYNIWILQKTEALNMGIKKSVSMLPSIESLSSTILPPEFEEFKNNFIKENLSDIKDRYNDINKILQQEKGISLEFMDELNAYKHG